MKRRSLPRGEGPPEGPRVGFVSLGCAKNLVDSEVMLGHLDRAGCSFVTDPADADVLVVNTCAFIEPAREESIRAILEAAEHKKAGRARRLVVAGCMVQRHAGELRASLPEVDAFVGLDELDRVVAGAGIGGAAAPPPAPAPPSLPLLPADRPVPGASAADAGPDSPRRSTYLYDDRTPRLLATPPWTAFVKIAEGCDHTCSFCAIPAFRGAFRSRRPESILREAANLARSGVLEIGLIAQDSSHYGRDLGLPDALPRLLEGLDAVDGLRWIRLHYLYPNTVTDSLIETMARLPRVAPYVDLPLQHSHPDTLRRMRRGGSADAHLALVQRIRSAMPGAALRTTFITGFPGETEREFGALLEFVEEARFDYVGVFPYSHEDGTAAATLANDVPFPVKEDRRRRLMELQREITRARHEALLGREVEVLVEGAHPETEHLLVGRMATQAPEVDGQVLLVDGFGRPGAMARVAIDEVAGYDLVGRILGDA